MGSFWPREQPAEASRHWGPWCVSGNDLVPRAAAGERASWAGGRARRRAGGSCGHGRPGHPRVTAAAGRGWAPSGGGGVPAGSRISASLEPQAGLPREAGPGRRWRLPAGPGPERTWVTAGSAQDPADGGLPAHLTAEDPGCRPPPAPPTPHPPTRWGSVRLSSGEDVNGSGAGCSENPGCVWLGGSSRWGRWCTWPSCRKHPAQWGNQKTSRPAAGSPEPRAGPTALHPAPARGRAGLPQRLPCLPFPELGARHAAWDPGCGCGLPSASCWRLQWEGRRLPPTAAPLRGHEVGLSGVWPVAGTWAPGRRSRVGHSSECFGLGGFSGPLVPGLACVPTSVWHDPRWSSSPRGPGLTSAPHGTGPASARARQPALGRGLASPDLWCGPGQVGPGVTARLCEGTAMPVGVRSRCLFLRAQRREQSLRGPCGPGWGEGPVRGRPGSREP